VPIPAFDGDFLPAGIHDCSFDELRERFGQFRRTDQRCRLFEWLEVLLRQVQATGFFVAMIVDGSFVTDTDCPNDIDLILVPRQPRLDLELRVDTMYCRNAGFAAVWF
jgi:hypothetical protein